MSNVINFPDTLPQPPCDTETMRVISDVERRWHLTEFENAVEKLIKNLGYTYATTEITRWAHALRFHGWDQ